MTLGQVDMSSQIVNIGLTSRPNPNCFTNLSKVPAHEQETIRTKGVVMRKTNWNRKAREKGTSSYFSLYSPSNKL